MSNLHFQLGKQSDEESPVPADLQHISPTGSPNVSDRVALGQTRAFIRSGSMEAVHTVGELLDVLKNCGASAANPVAMLQTAAGHVCRYLGVPLDECPIEKLRDLGDAFKSFLKENRYTRNSIRSYRHYVQVLLRKAMELGWHPGPGPIRPEIEEAWGQIAARMTDPISRRYVHIVHYAAQQGKTPAGFGDADLAAWAELKRNQGRSDQYITTAPREFRRTIVRLGLSVHFPLLSPPVPRFVYGIPFHQLPEQLQGEINEILRWKQVAWNPDRSSPRARHRPVTAHLLKEFLCRLYGFAVNTCGRQPATVGELADRRVILPYIEWFLNERKKKSDSLRCCLKMLPPILRDHPTYTGQDFTWLDKLIRRLPHDPEDSIKEAKERKWVDYELLKQIPDKIRRQVTEIRNPGREQLALIARDELLMSWIVLMPWRKRNFCEMKVAPSAEGGNLFKESLPVFTVMYVPRWAKEALQLNPHETFWQCYFRDVETKAKHTVRLLLPRKLVPMLEKYLQHHRSALLKGADPGTLFINNTGGALSNQSMRHLVGRLTRKHAGRRVTPHLFRSIFAAWWLKRHPGDYLTVAKALWHKSTNLVEGTYGVGFDESHAVGQIEEWLDDANK
jgi:integrase